MLELEAAGLAEHTVEVQSERPPQEGIERIWSSRTVAGRLCDPARSEQIEGLGGLQTNR